jgi:hypothetical protein
MERSMSIKDQFTADEWKSVAHGPFLISTAIGMADPSGPFGMMKEGMALAGAVKHAIQGEAGELAKEVATDLRHHRPSRSDLVGEGVRSTDEARTNAVAKLRSVAALVGTKAGADAAAYTSWLAGIAGAVAEAGKEGGFLGIGGEAVSADEEQAITEIRSALGA